MQDKLSKHGAAPSIRTAEQVASGVVLDAVYTPGIRPQTGNNRATLRRGHDYHRSAQELLAMAWGLPQHPAHSATEKEGQELVAHHAREKTR